MRPATSRYTKTLKPRIALLHGEAGASTLEWLGMMAAVLALAGAMVLALQASSGGPVPGAIEERIASLIRGILAGDGDGVNAPGIEEPGVNEPGITSNATGLAELFAPWATGPSAGDGRDGSGGSWWDRLWGTVEDGWNGFWGAVGGAASWAWDGITSTWNGIVRWWNSEDANWAKGMLTGILGALAVVGVIALLVVVGIVAVKLAIVMAIVAVVVGAAYGLWYGLTQVQGLFSSEDFWTVFKNAAILSGFAAFTVWSLGTLVARFGWMGVAKGGSWFARFRAGGLGRWVRGGFVTGIINAALYPIVAKLSGEPLTIGGALTAFGVGFLAGAIEVGLIATFIVRMAKAPALTGFWRFMDRLALGLVGAVYRFFFKVNEIIKFVGRSTAFIGLSGLLGVLSSGVTSIFTGKPFGITDALLSFALAGIAGAVAIPFVLTELNDWIAEMIKSGITSGSSFFPKLFGTRPSTPTAPHPAPMPAPTPVPAPPPSPTPEPPTPPASPSEAGTHGAGRAVGTAD